MKKRIIYALCISLIFTSCVMDSSYDQRSADNNKELVKDVFKAFNRHDFKLMTSYYADTAKFLDPELGKEFVQQSHEQVAARYTTTATTFPNLKDSTTSIIASQNKIVTEFISTGSSADGKSFSMRGCTVFKIENSKIVSNATYYDSKGL